MRRLLQLAALALCASSALPQNFDHPGQVSCAGAGWLTPEAAKAKGFFEYRGRWYAAKLKSKLEGWEKEDAKHVAWKDAYKLESEHYRVVSNVPRFILELEIVPFLDELYRTYVKVFASDFGVSGRAANKKLIRIFNGFEGFGAYSAEQRETSSRMAPAYIMGGSELVTYYEETDPANFYGSVFHEAAHQFVAAVLPGATFPTWLDEGLATYFEGCTYSRATNRITPGFLPPDRLESAQDQLRSVAASPGESLTMRMFASVPQAQFQATHYALSWSFIYYLVHRDDGKFKPAFMKFLRQMNGSGAKPVPEVFKVATGTDLLDAEKGWKDFVLSLQVPKSPKWIFLTVSGADAPASGLLDSDIIFSFDGVTVFDATHFDQLWAARAKDRPLKVVVIRRTKAPAPVEYTESFVSVDLPPAKDVSLGMKHQLTRESGLRD